MSVTHNTASGMTDAVRPSARNTARIVAHTLTLLLASTAAAGSALAQSAMPGSATVLGGALNFMSPPPADGVEVSTGGGSFSQVGGTAGASLGLKSRF